MSEPIPKIYAIADAEALGGVSLVTAVRRMAAGGVRWIQVRAKALSDSDLAEALADCCRALEGRGADLWVNDRPDLAKLLPVRGVHLGQDDLPPAAARHSLPAETLIGRSTHNAGQLRQAAADRSVDVIAVGPVFATSGKRNPDPVIGLDGVRSARAVTDKPLVAIGGIDGSNLMRVLEAGADAVAMISAVCTNNIEESCRRLISLAEEAA